MTTWVRRGNWATHKNETYYSPDQQVQYLYEELRQIDQNIHQRPDGERFGSKEEIDARAKIVSIICAHAKNNAHNWRNINREYTPDRLPKTNRRYDGFEIFREDKQGNWIKLFNPAAKPKDKTQ